MKIKAVLFDLDGTLLPMDEQAFTQAYFGELAKAVSPLGITAEALVPAVWAGTKAMVKNDGARRNDEIFWEVFCELIGLAEEKVRPLTDEFYLNGFHRARSATGENPLAKTAVELAHAGGRKVVLATNPVFPLAGQLSRISWLGLEENDFDLITSYESERFCKPNPNYYARICERIGIAPGDCLMVGNDELEDMHAASSLGIRCYHVTDCAILRPEYRWEGAHGGFVELIEFLKNL